MGHSIYVCTLHRPWDWAIAHRDKRVENRDYEPRLKPPWYMAIRGGKTWDGALGDVPSPEEWLSGRVTAIAEVTAHLPPGQGKPGRWRNLDAWGWVLGRVATLREPVIWPPPEVIAQRERSMKGLVLLEPDSYVYDAKLRIALREAWRACFGSPR